MKNNKVIIILGVWVFLICSLIGFNIIRDIKKNNNLQRNNVSSESESLIVNSVVGDFQNNEKDEVDKKEDIKENNVDKENNDDMLASLVLDTNELKEINVVDEKFGTKIYDEIIYEIKDGKKVKKKVTRLIDASNYHATLNELKSEANNLINENKDVYNEILNYTNNYRQELGLNNLILDDNLNILATIRALELLYTNNFSHTRLDGSNCTDLANLLNIKYQVMGENIAHGYNNSLKVTEGWRNSVNHYKNMVNKKYNKLGVGSVSFNGNIYWVQIFSD